MSMIMKNSSIAGLKHGSVGEGPCRWELESCIIEQQQVILLVVLFMRLEYGEGICGQALSASQGPTV